MGCCSFECLHVTFVDIFPSVFQYFPCASEPVRVEWIAKLLRNTETISLSTFSKCSVHAMPSEHLASGDFYEVV